MAKKKYVIRRQAQKKAAARGARAVVDFPVTTTDDLPGFEVVEFLGLVRGVSVKTNSMTKDLAAGLKSALGGTLTDYQQLPEDSLEAATVKLRNQARKRGANGIVGFRVATTQLGTGFSEVVTYGAAVRVEPSGQAAGSGEIADGN